MQEESDQKCENGIEPSMNRHKPASEKTQVKFHLMIKVRLMRYNYVGQAYIIIYSE